MKQLVVSRKDWIRARKILLEQEKEFTRLRDELSRLRRQMPWVKVKKKYELTGPNGVETLAGLFDGKSQRVIYHFMYEPVWKDGCPSCSFWADNFNGIDIHLKHRDITLIAVSRALLAKLEAYKKRMGWTFKWVSSLDSDFNFDHHVSFTPEEIKSGEMYYNYRTAKFPDDEAPGISVFYKDEHGDIFHTVSV